MYDATVADALQRIEALKSQELGLLEEGEFDPPIARKHALVVGEIEIAENELAEFRKHSAEV